jgi:hypothetical protein
MRLDVYNFSFFADYFFAISAKKWYFYEYGFDIVPALCFPEVFTPFGSTTSI